MVFGYVFRVFCKSYCIVLKKKKKNIKKKQSLSKSSLKKWPRHDNYWTGPIWINLNYMLVRALRVYGYADTNKDARNLLDTLQPRLINAIRNEYQRTGKLWENYDPDTGFGRGTAPFTGWTSLVVLLMGDN